MLKHKIISTLFTGFPLIMSIFRNRASYYYCIPGLLILFCSRKLRRLIIYSIFRPIEILISFMIPKNLNNKYLINNYRPVENEIL